MAGGPNGRAHHCGPGLPLLQRGARSAAMRVAGCGAALRVAGHVAAMRVAGGGAAIGVAGGSATVRVAGRGAATDGVVGLQYA